MKIVVDAMGGDHAPDEIVKGAVCALSKDKELKVVLTGDEAKISPVLAGLSYDKSRLEVVHCTEVITNDDAPTLAIRQKKDSSLVVALKLLKEDEEVQGFVSAGSTGAVLTGALLRVGRIRGISRPAWWRWATRAAFCERLARRTSARTTTTSPSRNSGWTREAARLSCVISQ